MWQCPRQAYLPFTCPEFQNHRDRPEWLLDLAVSSVGNSPALEVLVCKPGYQLAQDGSTCEWCQPGFFCDGSNANGNGAQQCPRGRMSGPMSQSEGDCYKCTPNYYCDANSAGQETPCPPNTISPPASESLQDCTCMEGYYNKLPLEQGCTICPAGYICPGAQQRLSSVLLPPQTRLQDHIWTHSVHAPLARSCFLRILSAATSMAGSSTGSADAGRGMNMMRTGYAWNRGRAACQGELHVCFSEN